MLDFIGKIFNLDQNEKNYLYNLGVEKIQIGDYESAHKFYTILIMIEPQNSLYIKALAGVLHSQKKYEEAILRYQESYQLLENPENSDNLYYMADCYINLGQKDKAKLILEDFLLIIHVHQNLQQKYERIIKRSKLIIKGIINEQNRAK
jgi:tetratricopeptide (TPR) repeat protein